MTFEDAIKHMKDGKTIRKKDIKDFTYHIEESYGRDCVRCYTDNYNFIPDFDGFDVLSDNWEIVND